MIKKQFHDDKYHAYKVMECRHMMKVLKYLRHVEEVRPTPRDERIEAIRTLEDYLLRLEAEFIEEFKETKK